MKLKVKLRNMREINRENILLKKEGYTTFLIKLLHSLTLLLHLFFLWWKNLVAVSHIFVRSLRQINLKVSSLKWNHKINYFELTNLVEICYSKLFPNISIFTSFISSCLIIQLCIFSSKTVQPSLIFNSNRTWRKQSSIPSLKHLFPVKYA